MRKILLIALSVAVLIIIYIFYNFSFFEDLAYLNLASISQREAHFLYAYAKNFGINRSLKKGDSGRDVKILQNILKMEVDKKLPITGIFADKTEKSLIKFQKKYNLTPTGYLDEETLNKINELYYKLLCPSPEKDYPDFLLYPVSKKNPLPLDYIPPDLINITNQVSSVGIICLRKEAAKSLITMLNDAKKEGLDIIVISGFRRPEIQKFLYYSYIRVYGKKALDIIAQAGHSEHQLGTAVDLDSKTYQTKLTSRFEETPEGKWLKENSWKYGFVMSYPRAAKEITGYDYEPWHFRYIGKEHAAIVANLNLIPNQYLQIIQYLEKTFGKLQKTNNENKND
jgi:LAS superfamily LD-carboxypeptidase LdcB